MNISIKKYIIDSELMVKLQKDKSHSNIGFYITALLFMLASYTIPLPFLLEALAAAIGISVGSFSTYSIVITMLEKKLIEKPIEPEE